MAQVGLSFEPSGIVAFLLCVGLSVFSAVFGLLAIASVHARPPRPVEGAVMGTFGVVSCAAVIGFWVWQSFPWHWALGIPALGMVLAIISIARAATVIRK